MLTFFHSIHSSLAHPLLSCRLGFRISSRYASNLMTATTVGDKRGISKNYRVETVCVVYMHNVHTHIWKQLGLQNNNRFWDKRYGSHFNCLTWNYYYIWVFATNVDNLITEAQTIFLLFSTNLKHLAPINKSLKIICKAQISAESTATSVGCLRCIPAIHPHGVYIVLCMYI